MIILHAAGDHYLHDIFRLKESNAQYSYQLNEQHQDLYVNHLSGEKPEDINKTLR